MTKQPENWQLIGKKCCFCKRKIKDGEPASLLVGGSATTKHRRGKTMHDECYDRVIARLFRG